MVHQDETLDNCERFLILKECLTEKPLLAIAEFDETEANYPKALEQLKKRYDKKALMFQEHIAAIFAIEKSTRSSANHLLGIVNTVNARLSAMLSLGNYEDITNALIIYLVMERVDLESQAKWEETVDYTKLSSWEECSEVISRRCQTLEVREAKAKGAAERQNSSMDGNKGTKGFFNKRNASTLVIDHLKCIVCYQGEHELENCTKFVNMNIKERYVTVRTLKLCLLCLKKGHWCNRCSTARCVICHLPHHVLLHRNEDVTPATNEIDSDGNSNNEDISKKSALCTNRDSALEQVFLGTAVILIKDNCGRYISARAILDSASQVNLMCDSLAHTLRLPRMTCALDVEGVNGLGTIITRKVQAVIKSRLNDYERSLQFYMLPKITGKKPDQFVNTANWNLPRNIELADQQYNIPARVDILLGAEIFFDLLCVGQIKLHPNLPTLQKTTLGWLVSGCLKLNNEDCSKAHSLLNSIQPAEENGELLSQAMERFWQAEQIQTRSSFLTDEEAECERIFSETVCRDIDGKFIVKIPFKNNINQLGDSYQIAERRFRALEKRLNKEPEMKAAYAEFIEEYSKLGHMTRVATDDIASLKYFSPHQYVLRPESTSTKLRVVFDCSCKTSSGLSLNDTMMKGPIVQDDLLSIILRFRCYRFAITADVTKMYRQMWVTGEDTNFQAILWRNAPEEKLDVYRLLTVTYGTTAAPYLATRCLKKLGEDHVKQYAVGASKVVSDFYMDDFISGADTEAELHRIYHEVSTITNSANFKLRKWCSNNLNFLQQLPKSETETTLRINDAEIIKTLGIIWEPKLDLFRYVWPEISPTKRVTKRIVLAEMSTLFDPLGLVNPVIVKAKIFMQDLWLIKVAWDESLAMQLHNYWVEYRSKLNAVQSIKIPRFILSLKETIRIEIHGFADASERAYGCCVYIRTVDISNMVTVRLWSAKSRVAPLQTKSLPRLELMAAHLLTTLVVKLQENFRPQLDALFLWSDSEIVLQWLRAHPSTWSTFVANRVALIQEATAKATWRHVPSTQNPADIISRGAYVNELLESLWFTGPPFLIKPFDHWPRNKVINSTECGEERRTGMVALILDQKESAFLNWLEGRSDFEKVRKRVAYLLCIARQIKGVQGKPPILSTALLEEAMVRMVYCLQQHYFYKEYHALKKGGEVHTSSKLKGMSVFIESCFEVDIMRVGGRLRYADLPYDAKHQMLLPSDSNWVRSFVRYIHEKNMHVGPQALTSILRQRFWIIHVRKVVRSVTTKCFHCFKVRPRLQQQIMGSLPSERVNVSKPFTTTGVDFCGPMITTYKQRGMRTTKSYVAVFICFTTKAVHMELVSDLSAKAFIAALKRFIARRGLCTRLFCDNGTNFVGARRELKEFSQAFYNQQIQGTISNYCLNANIEFHHIPPRSPHFGGLWEAAVKSAKYHLTRVLGSAFLTYEELYTVVTEVEAILNSRPLTAMSTDPSDETVLTPAHFLVGRPLVGISEPIIEDEQISLRNRWRRLTAIQQHFWKRWSTEYLHELQRKSKWNTQTRNVTEGDLVLIADENQPPKCWAIGRVVKAIQDDAGRVRVVDIKTKYGCIRRAIHKVAVIPNPE